MNKLDKQEIIAKVFELYKTELETLPEELGGVPVFDQPDVRIVSTDDHVIKNFKNVIGDFHWSPQEALDKAFTSSCGSNPETPPKAVSVISWCLPTSDAARKTNRKESYYPSREWAWTRTFGENMSNRMKEKLSDWLTEKGYPSTAPGISPDFGFIQESPVGIASQ